MAARLSSSRAEQRGLEQSAKRGEELRELLGEGKAGRYTRERDSLGRGTYSTVHCGFDTKTQQPVAIKKARECAWSRHARRGIPVRNGYGVCNHAEHRHR